ncbi:heterokaryon incompatibility protein-domain-containing protein [Cercophora samala]|uniref:Heterokaryon incompatibility protein-domain-containing protein n=1 Tax=Cercophora samala TaxID=330535 RepID=A0AA39ZJ01_9PEZI|nr:heterokaryon incompatibility protein-domain-containing protein [Cercophora samala]
MYFALWPSSDREDRFQEVIQSTNTCSLGGQELWRHWVRDCSENHDHCKRLQRSSGFLPARLLEITGGALNGAPPTWRLLEEDDRPASVSYLTLSHCWGSKVPTRLTRATLDRFLSDDPKKPVSELPQTFQDAMNITLSMGLRHLWIDCLCIIQGDEDDWKEQSSVMSLIYRHATCNIAATWAKGGSEGCFSDRSPATATRTRITLQTSPERSTTGGFNMMPLGFYWEQVNSAPLNKRGWVVQERYMAPRQLNFAKGEVYWECSQLIASEQFPSGLPGSIVLPEVAHDYIRRSTQAQQVMQLKPHVGHGTELELRVAWTNILSRYTSSDLTFYKDKLMAIAGIASELRDSLNDEYLAGMWRKDLHKQLCWRAASAWDRECVWAHSRACLYLAPTWSWASCQGPLILDTSYHEGGPTGRAHFLEVIDARVEAEHPSGLHSFVSGTLKIRSIAMWARLEERVDLHDASIEVPSPSRRSGSGLDYLFGTMIYTLVWDEVFQEEPDAQKKLQESRKSDLLLAFVSGPSLRFPENYLHDIHGLILVPAGNGEFTRGGMFKHSRTLDSEYDISGLVCARLGLDHQVGLEGGFDLGDPRLSDLVHTVTIR